MRFPKYQWVQEQPDAVYGFCDTLYKRPFNITEPANAFQVIMTDEGFTETNIIETNPFDLITSTDLEFSFNWGTPYLEYNSYFTLYIEGDTYVFSFIENTEDTPFYDSSVIDGITYVNIYIAYDLVGTTIARVAIAGRLQVALAEIVDVKYGTTSFESGVYPFQITISDVPSGSYIDDSAWSILTNINTITPSSSVSEYLYWINSNLIYRIENPRNGGLPEYGLYKYSETFSVGDVVMFKYKYSSTSINFGVTVTIDDGISPPYIYNADIDLYGTLSFNYEVLNSGLHEIRFDIVDSELSLGTFKITEISNTVIPAITDVEVEDCDGNVTAIVWDDATPSEYIKDDTYLIRLLQGFPEVFRFKITDSDNNELFSRWYVHATETQCTNGELHKIQWTNTCNLDEIKYGDLPFINELLVSGVMIKQSNEIHDSIDNITASGYKKTIFRNTQASYEFRIHPYLAETFETILERIFEHSTVTINDKEYNTTDVLQTSELDLGVYTGRVDLLKKGTNLITANCC